MVLMYRYYTKGGGACFIEKLRRQREFAASTGSDFMGSLL